MPPWFTIPAQYVVQMTFASFSRDNTRHQALMGFGYSSSIFLSMLLSTRTHAFMEVLPSWTNAPRAQGIPRAHSQKPALLLPPAPIVLGARPVSFGVGAVRSLAPPAPTGERAWR